MAGYIAGWAPPSVPPPAAAFARRRWRAAGLCGASGPRTCCGRRAAGRLRAAARPDRSPGGAAAPVGDRAVRRALAGTGPGGRRTLRTNLRFIARRAVPHLCPADAPLPRERAKPPYTAAQIAGFLALATAQPTAARRMRAAALVCLGAGAGLTGAGLRAVRGADVTARSGGVVVQARGARPRAVPVLARYHQHCSPRRSSRGAGCSSAAVTPPGATSPARWWPRWPGGRAAPAGSLPAARHLAGRDRRPDRPARLHARRRDQLQPAARRHHRRPGPRQRGRRRRAAGGPAGRPPAVSVPLAAAQDIIDASGVAPWIEDLLPRAVRGRQLSARTLLIGMTSRWLTAPAQLTRVHAALTALPEADQVRLGVTPGRPGRISSPTARSSTPSGWPSRPWARTTRRRAIGRPASSLRQPAGGQHPARSRTPPALAADWTDVESWSRPPRHGTTSAPTPRRPGATATPTCPAPAARCSSATTSASRHDAEENGPPVPELARRMTCAPAP